MVEAAALFNASDARAHGRRDRAQPRASRRSSIVVLSGPNPEVVVTFAWDISWYQYRVNRDATQPVRLAERGLEPGELEREVHGLERATSSPGLGVMPGSREPSRTSLDSGRLHSYDETWVMTEADDLLRDSA